MIWGINSVPAHAETIQVTIDKLLFSPMELKAKVVDTITGINKDIVAHMATTRGDFGYQTQWGLASQRPLGKQLRSFKSESFAKVHPAGVRASYPKA
jgi:plastocyanin